MIFDILNVTIHIHIATYFRKSGQQFGLLTFTNLSKNKGEFYQSFIQYCKIVLNTQYIQFVRII